MRFIEKENFIDTVTGLEWSKENFGPMDWYTANEVFTDSSIWRLPTIQELLTLVDYTTYSPATQLPHMLSSYYWSSTTNASYTYDAWLVNFDHGYDNGSNKSYDYYVRVVRR